jgi:hypothetical protein
LHPEVRKQDSGAQARSTSAVCLHGAAESGGQPTKAAPLALAAGVVVIGLVMSLRVER